ncbi:MAG: SDR family oxidoreductase [Paludibacter sp.]|nr:SDR family oxidoreductase [Paludibacter sp.]
MNPFELTNKKVLITGASSGIGRAIAIVCSQMGAQVYITGRNAAALQDTFESLNTGSHKMIVADLTDNDALESLIDQLPTLDAVVQNAGVNRRMLTQYIKELEMDKVLLTNLIAPIKLTKMLLKQKKINSGASVVFMSSIAAFHSSIGDGVYSATKGGIASFAKVLALELAPKQIRVNTVQPGMVKTDLIKHGPLSDEEYAKDEQRYPLGRYGKAEEIAYAVVYLLSDASKWVTGTDLKIDGGISLI